MGMKSTVRARLLGRERLDQLADAVAELTRVANHAASQADQSLEIATASRDEMRQVSIRVTEQLNSLSVDLRTQG